MLDTDIDGTGVEPALREPQPCLLLIDDDPFQLTLQSHVLRALGYRHVAVHDNGQAALADVRANPGAYDIVFCDLNMPGMDGIEFLHALNASPFRGQVILSSGEGTRVLETVRKLLGRGGLLILGTLAKPVGRAAVKAMLARWKPTVAAAPLASAPTYDVIDLERAARERQWALHYQPKVELKTGAIAGVEALIRWNHPAHGIVMPDRFIGLAEDCGVIDALTEWVFGEAIGQLAAWRRRGIRLRMAINVSAANLTAPDFAQRLVAIVREFDVPTSDITLEITESRVISPSAVPLETLVRLRMQRFNLSIDDFGTGHSSLVQLRDIPFTELKVDRGFVRGARSNAIIRPILESSLGLAKRLGMQSVAEGVETAEDWHLLRELECDLAQGYFIGRPAPADGLLGWMADWAERREGLLK